MEIEEAHKFSPSDEVLIRCLLNKVTGSRSLGWGRAVDDLMGKKDLFGTEEPWEVFGGNREKKEKYFFTELRRVAKNRGGDGRVCRNVGLGYWSNKGQKSWIRGRNGGLIGYKRAFRYERKKGGGQMMNSDCDWLMKEYLLTGKTGVKEKYANYALCALKWKKKKKGSGSGCGGPTADEISAAADVVFSDEFLRQELADDDLIDYDDDDDDAPGDDDRAVPPIDDDRRPLIGEEECSGRATVDDADHDRVQLLDKSPNLTVDDDRHRVLIGPEEENPLDAGYYPLGEPFEGPLVDQVALDEWLDGNVEEEFSLLATAPPSRGFDFGDDFRCDHFAAWDVFCDPWAVGTQQMQMLPLVV